MRSQTSLIVVTTDHVAGRTVTESLGLVTGATIRARHVGHDLMAAFRNLVGGEIPEYTKMMAESREQSLDRLREAAGAIGADAVVGLRFTTSMIQAGAAEILAYGTAVRLAD